MPEVGAIHLWHPQKDWAETAPPTITSTFIQKSENAPFCFADVAHPHCEIFPTHPQIHLNPKLFLSQSHYGALFY